MHHFSWNEEKQMARYAVNILNRLWNLFELTIGPTFLLVYRSIYPLKGIDQKKLEEESFCRKANIKEQNGSRLKRLIRIEKTSGIMCKLYALPRCKC